LLDIGEARSDIGERVDGLSLPEGRPNNWLTASLAF
jgi:hypothetical protein